MIVYQYVSLGTATQSTSTPPAGCRVLLLQGLVTNSEYNGKRACVRFFDDQTGRYTVKLDDDGERLSLKPEFVVPDETDQPSLAVRALRNFAHRLDAHALSFGLCLTQLAQPPGKNVELDPVSAQSVELLCHA